MVALDRAEHASEIDMVAGHLLRLIQQDSETAITNTAAAIRVVLLALPSDAEANVSITRSVELKFRGPLSFSL